jgi:ketosteroid isomerase-like protein
MTDFPNLDLVRSIYADWERGDFGRSDWMDPGIEWVWVDGPDPATWHGLAGMAEGFRGFFSAWADARVEAEEFRELDAGRVLVLFHGAGRGKASGITLPSDELHAHVFHVREGRITRFLTYFDRDRALADLGLEG